MLKVWGRKSSSNVQALMWCIGELAHIPGPPVIKAAMTGDVRGGFDWLTGEKMREQIQDCRGEP